MQDKDQRPGRAATTGIQPQAAVILYSAEDGTIVSTHYFAATARCELPGAEELEKLAFAQAASDSPELAKGGEAGALAAIHERPGAIERGKAYRVDVKGRVLVEVSLES